MHVGLLVDIVNIISTLLVPRLALC